MEQKLSSFEAFWPFYVSQHLHPCNRALHFLGTSLALASVTTALTLWAPVGLLAAPILGYGLAWIGHYFFEKNRPATFAHPWWSLRGDFRMYRLMWMARMEPELDRASSLYPAEA